MIAGVEIHPLQQIPDNRGTVKFFLTDKDIDKFAHCYITTVYQNVIKGWHGYQSKTLNYCVPFGMIKLVLFDNRRESKTYLQTQEIYLGTDNYCRVVIPPGIMNAFQGITHPYSMAVVICNEPYDESKMIRWPINNSYVLYDWTKVNK